MSTGPSKRWRTPLRVILADRRLCPALGVFAGPREGPQPEAAGKVEAASHPSTRRSESSFGRENLRCGWDDRAEVFSSISTESRSLCQSQRVTVARSHRVGAFIHNLAFIIGVTSLDPGFVSLYATTWRSVRCKFVYSRHTYLDLARTDCRRYILRTDPYKQMIAPAYRSCWRLCVRPGKRVRPLLAEPPGEGSVAGCPDDGWQRHKQPV